MNKPTCSIFPYFTRIAPVGLFAIVVLLNAPLSIRAQATRVTSADHGYSVVFPAAAENVSSAPASEAGEKWGLAPGTKVSWTLEMYRSVFERQMFLLGYTQYVGPGLQVNTDTELKANQNNFLKGLSGELVSSRAIEFTGTSGAKIRGLEFMGETNELALHGKCFVLGNEVWGIFYITAKGNSSTAARDQFYQSLEIRR